MGICLRVCHKNSVTEEEMKNMTDEEKVILKHEYSFLFTKYDFKELIKTFKACSCNDALSGSQLRRAFNDLKISQDELCNPDGRVYRVMKKTKNKKKLYDLNKLFVLSILLGDGSNDEKAEWLFRQYDTDASDELGYSEINTMVQDFIQAIICILPFIGIGEGLGSFTRVECEEFVKKMLENKEKVENEFMADFKEHCVIGHDQFVELMNGDSNISKILSPYSVREALTRT